MKRVFVFGVLGILLVLSVGIVSAGFWDWFLGPKEDVRLSPSQVVIWEYVQTNGCSGGDTSTSWFSNRKDIIHHCNAKKTISAGDIVVTDSYLKTGGCGSDRSTSYFYNYWNDNWDYGIIHQCVKTAPAQNGMQVVVYSYLQTGGCSPGDTSTSWFGNGYGNIHHCVRKETLSFGGSIPCVDNDGGKNLSKKDWGTSSYYTSPIWDFCHENGKVGELECRNNELLHIYYDCPSGKVCEDGQCVSPQNTNWCIDEDGGKELLVKGKGWSNYYEQGIEDYCLNENTIRELECVGDKKDILLYNNYPCPTGTKCNATLSKCVSSGNGNGDGGGNVGGCENKNSGDSCGEGKICDDSLNCVEEFSRKCENGVLKVKIVLTNEANPGKVKIWKGTNTPARTPDYEGLLPLSREFKIPGLVDAIIPNCQEREGLRYRCFFGQFIPGKEYTISATGASKSYVFTAEDCGEPDDKRNYCYIDSGGVCHGWTRSSAIETWVPGCATNKRGLNKYSCNENKECELGIEECPSGQICLGNGCVPITLGNIKEVCDDKDNTPDISTSAKFVEYDSSSPNIKKYYIVESQVNRLGDSIYTESFVVSDRGEINTYSTAQDYGSGTAGYIFESFCTMNTGEAAYYKVNCPAGTTGNTRNICARGGAMATTSTPEDKGGGILKRIFTGGEQIEQNTECETTGLRKQGKYCSFDKIWTEQVDENEVCENDFECTSNVCIEARCESKKGLIASIIQAVKEALGFG